MSGGNMPDWVWVVGAVLVSAIVVQIMIIVGRTGSKLSIGKGGVTVVNGSVQNKESPLYKPLKYAEDTMPLVQSILYGVFLRLLKEAGADVDKLAAYEDSKFANMLLQYAVHGGNGSRSVQKIMEAEIVDRRWVGEDATDYCRVVVWPQVVATLKRYINSEYDSQAMGNDGQMYDRMVSNTQFADGVTDDGTREKVITVLSPIIRYADCTVGARKGCVEDLN